MSYVTIDQVTKGYENQVVLNNISLTLNKGEFVTLLGQSGCGKSTLLRSIAGLEDVDVGRILIDGTDITNLSPRQREVGMVFQSYALFPNMNVFDNIAYGLKMKKAKNIDSRVKKMIDMVDLNRKRRVLSSSVIWRTTAEGCSCPCACHGAESTAYWMSR